MSGRALVRRRVEDGEDAAVAVDLAVGDHRVVDRRGRPPGDEQERQVLHLVERVDAGLAGVAAR
jgi:hypothetical protein